MPDIMLVVTLLTSGKLKQSERQDLSIYRTMGLPCTAMSRSFSLRFLLVSLVGSDRLARCGHGPDGADADVWHEQLQLPDGDGRHRFAGGRDCLAVHRFCLPGLRKDQACAAYRTDAGAIDFEGSRALSPLPWARKDRRAACMAPASKRRHPSAALSVFPALSWLISSGNSTGKDTAGLQRTVFASSIHSFYLVKPIKYKYLLCYLLPRILASSEEGFRKGSGREGEGTS